MKLLCRRHYANPPYGYYFEAGHVLEATPEERRFLMADSPTTFVDYVEREPASEVPESERKQVQEPPEDKMVSAPPAHKAARRRRRNANG